MRQKKILGKPLVVIIFLFIIALAVFLAFNPKVIQAPVQGIFKHKLTIGKNELTVEIANTPEEMAQGLSGRKSLGKNEGMYFELGKTQTAIFWMKEMQFPLDIIWVKNNKIVGVEKNAPVPNGTNIATFNSPGEVTNVLEVNAGYFDKNKLQSGDNVMLQ